MNGSSPACLQSHLAGFRGGLSLRDHGFRYYRALGPPDWLRSNIHEFDGYERAIS
jgi:hypothetical protein